jgi:hypothetical protein
MPCQRRARPEQIRHPLNTPHDDGADLPPDKQPASTIRYLGIEVDGAIEIAEGMHSWSEGRASAVAVPHTSHVTARLASIVRRSLH